jgi:thioredoxin reductase (NADPH)
MEERDVIIIGAGPAGLSAAIFTQIDDWRTLALEANWVGGQGSIAYTVMNYPGFLTEDGEVLMNYMEKQVTSPLPSGVGAELRQEEVTYLDAKNMLVTTRENQYQTKAIILATGSVMQKLGIPGEDKFIHKGVSYYAKRDYNQFFGKRVLVIGGGNSTAKSAIIANSKASEVIMVHRRESLRAYPFMARRLQKEGIKIWYNTEVKDIRGSDKVETVLVKNNKTAEQKEVAIDWIVICVGTEPNIRLAKEAGIEMEGKFVKVDNQMRTNREGVFACGEIIPGHRHLITSTAEGASAGMAASEYLALQMVKKGKLFEGSKNGKYASDYLAMLS